MPKAAPSFDLRPNKHEKEIASARQYRSLCVTEHQCLQETPLNRSFMHLHLGFDATGLEDLELHHIIVNSWEGGVDTEQVCTTPSYILA